MDMCEKCSVTMTLKAKCTSDRAMLVTSADINVLQECDVVPLGHRGYHREDEYDMEGRPSSDEDGVTIVKLGRNQEIDLTCIAKKGVGKEHAKWCPVATAVYQIVPEITLDERKVAMLDEAQKKEFVDCCPTKVYRYDDKNDTVAIEDLNACTYCDECVVKAADFGVPNMVHIRHKQYPKGHEFIFNVESTGAIRPEEVVLMAFEVLIDKLNKIFNEVNKLWDVSVQGAY